MAIKKTVLVTGAGGFIGSHLVEACLKRNFKVRAFVRYNSRNNWNWLEDLPALKNIEVVPGDIRDYDSVNSAMRGCDTVFHLAALIGIPYSYVSPLAYLKTNIEGTYNVLQSAKELCVKNIIVTSTSEVYGTAQYIPMDEKHPVVGQSPYAASKVAADQLAISYYRSFGLPVKIARPFNAYGPRQSARAVIPAIITQIAGGAKELKLGNLSPKRDYTFVRDTVAGFLALDEAKGLYGEAVNIGSGMEISIGELAKMIVSVMKVNVRVVEDRQRTRLKGSEVERLVCDNRRMLTLTDWRPQVTLDKGLKATVDWVAVNLKMYKTGIYNV
jgi:NAD dependent epimerase/dehydratase